MRHEQDRLVPIGEVVGELDGSVPAIPPALAAFACRESAEASLYE